MGIALEIKSATGTTTYNSHFILWFIKHVCCFFIGKLIKDFENALKTNKEFVSKIESLKSEVQEYAEKFPMPGFEDH